MRIDNDDEFAMFLRGADPVRTEALPDPDGPDALRIRTRALQRSRRTRLRRLVLIPAAAVVAVVGATAGAVALVGGGDGHVSDASAIECIRPSTGQSDFVGGAGVLTDDPVGLCREVWGVQGYQTAERLTACAPADGQGRVTVYPGGPEVCEEHDQVAYAGTTGEQQRLRLVQDELPDRISDSACVTVREAVAIADELLAEHHLTRWDAVAGGEDDLFGLAASLGKTGCAVWVAYVEHDREIVFAPHTHD